MAQLNYRTLRQEVVDAIRTKILNGELRPGERIKEKEIAQTLGVSRGPVREALRQIEQEGLIRYERNVGCSVRRFNENDIREVCILRATMEILAIQLCQGHFSYESLYRMEQALAQMERSQQENNLAAMVEADNQFHGESIRQTGYPKFQELWDNLATSNTAVFNSWAVSGERELPNQRKVHEELLLLYRRGNVEELCQAIRKHYDLTAKHGQQDEVFPLLDRLAI